MLTRATGLGSPAAKTTTQRARRLRLLEAAEISALYNRPQFTDEERATSFALKPIEAARMLTWSHRH